MDDKVVTNHIVMAFFFDESWKNELLFENLIESCKTIGKVGKNLFLLTFSPLIVGARTYRYMTKEKDIQYLYEPDELLKNAKISTVLIRA